jgi:hypothetical protein
LAYVEALQGLADSHPFESYRTDLTNGIAALPLRSTDKRVIRMAVGLEEPSGRLVDPWERDHSLSSQLCRNCLQEAPTKG